MGVRFGLAKGVGGIATWGLRSVARRPAANLPGKLALRVDPSLISDLAPRIHEKSIVVVGTNGKTTVTNLLADVVEGSGKSIVCNRTGANLGAGVATALMQSKGAEWGVIECDELWSAKVVPQLKPTYFLLLNLFRDQLDRCGEIDRIQDSIVSALEHSPQTVLIYNADDPLCAMIAERAGQIPARAQTRMFAFGVGEDMGLAQNVVSDATMCQRCSSMFEYGYRQYGQLGDYHCPECGFARPELDFVAKNVHLSADGLSFDVFERVDDEVADGAGAPADKADVPADATADAAADAPGGMVPINSISAPFTGAYMVYNLTAIAAASQVLGISAEVVRKAIEAFDPHNGRLQDYVIGGRRVLLNLAKNPTGFNQNLKIVAQDKNPKVVAFFINDKVADGHDISWIWDIDFEELVAQQNCTVFAGGIRKNDLQVRLKYAGVKASLVNNMNEVIAAVDHIEGLDADARVYAIANYTALPAVKAALDSLENEAGENVDANAAMNETEAEVVTEVAAAVTNAETGGIIVDAGEVEAAAAVTAEAEEEAAAAGAGTADASAADAGAGATTADSNPAVTTNAKSDVHGASASADDMSANSSATAGVSAEASPLVIAHLFPDLMNLYGDGGNVRILEQRLAWRNIPAEVRRIHHGESIDLSEVDLVFLGGGPDREQRLASTDLMAMRDDLANFVEAGGVLLAICGGYQILGNVWLLGEDEVPGLGIVDIETHRPGTSADRLIDNIVLRSTLSARPVVGYENHAGRTYLGDDTEDFGKVISSMGHGNNDTSGVDGVRYRNIIGTYLHGPLLSKNPDIADFLLEKACARQAERLGIVRTVLEPLNDAEEKAANEFMCKQLGVSASDS